MRFLKPALAALALAASPATAFDLREALASSVMLDAGVNAEFDQHRTTPAQLYFEFALPKESDALLVSVRPGSDPGYLTVFVGTPEKALVETILLLHVEVPEGETEARLDALGNALATIFFPMLTQAHAEASVLRVSNSLAGRYPAVELLGRYIDSGANGRGLIFVRMLGLLPPAGSDSLIISSEMNAEILKPETTSDLARSVAGNLADSLTFTARRDETGEMVPF
jgi:hypothetical protein